MWRGPGQDPGGGSSDPPNQELMDLKDQFDQQQVLIEQLKEMLRKNEQTSVSTVTQEKVEEYKQRLSSMNARVKKSKLRKEGAKSEVVGVPGSKRLETAHTEKTTLLRQQMEETK